MPEETKQPVPPPSATSSQAQPSAPAERAKFGKPVQITEPPKEVLAMEFKMDDSLPIADDMDRSTIKAPVIVSSKEELPAGITDDKTTKVKESPKTVKVEEPAKVEEPVKARAKGPLDLLKPAAKKEGEVAKKTEEVPSGNRDYSIFDQDEQEAAKQMSNSAFQLATKLKKASKEGSEAMFYQHPEAYTTHPEYKKTQEDLSYAQKETQIWAQQLANCKAGKPFQQLLKWTADGKPVFSNPIEPTDEAEEALRQCVYELNQQTTKIKSNLDGFGTKYKQEYQNYSSNVQAERAKRFAWAANPELLDSTLDLGGEMGEKSVRQIKQDYVSLFPSHLSNDIAVQIGSDLLVAMLMQQTYYKSLEESTKVSSTISNEEERVEPTSGTKPKAQKSAFGSISEFSSASMPTVN